MSKEATGENGAILGGGEYWSRVNRTTFFGGLMGRPSETNYQEILREVGGRVGDAVEEIYDDLQQHKKQLAAMESDRRNQLAKQVHGLYDVCRMAGSSCCHSGECISMLALSGFFSNPFSDDRAIQNAIRKIKNHPDFFPASAWSYFKRLRIGAFPMLRAAVRKNGRFWKMSPRVRAKTFCRKLWTPTKAAAARRIPRGSAVPPLAAATI